MTTNAAFKKTVHAFAALNNIKYTSALREFDGRTGLLRASVRDVEPGPDRSSEDRWARARGLVRSEPHGCFHQLASSSGRGGSGHRYDAYRMGCSFQDDWQTVFKDHGRAFLFRGANDSRRRLAVVTFAPYRRWDDQTIRDEVHEVALEHDLRFRIGMVRDATYGSGTTPVVIWNPRVIDLP